MADGDHGDGLGEWKGHGGTAVPQRPISPQFLRREIQSFHQIGSATMSERIQTKADKLETGTRN